MSRSRSRTVLWKRNDIFSFERCTLTEGPTPEDQSITLSGTVLTTVENTPVEIHYEIGCSSGGQTRSARVRMQYRDSVQQLELRSDGGRWWRSGRELPELQGLMDIDLGFTPSTNTLPIRRLALDVGDSADVTTVWVRFPDLAVLTLPQRYTRIDGRKYRYESRGGEFTAELEVDDAGLVLNYGKYWERIASYPVG